MPETPEMVERVAKSMYDGFQRAVGHNFGPDWAPIPFEAADAQCRHFYRFAAREGIQAMREPNAEMIEIGSKTEFDTWNGKGKTFADDPRPIYHAMIDAALAAPEEGREP